MIGCRGLVVRFVIVMLLNIVLFACDGGNSTSKPETEYVAYQKALVAYRNNNYATAVSLFQQQIRNYPSGSYLFKAYYYSGRASFSLNDFSLAQSQFEVILTRSDTKFLLDNAQYWSAKSFHRLDSFERARLEYAKVNNLSQWADNAAFQIGKTHYDQAKFEAFATNEYQQLTLAIPILHAMIANPIYRTSSSFDDALYYLGRSYQVQGNLLLTDSGLAVTETSSSQYANAKIEFAKLDNSSIYFDDANFQLARIVYQIAEVEVDPVKAYSNFSRAILALQIFTNDAAFSDSNRFDDAIYFLAHSFHERGNLLLKSLKILTNAGVVSVDTECDTVAICLLSARTEYARLSSNSNYHDDGKYYSARTFHIEGNYSAAREIYALLVNENTSNWADDAKYHIAKTYYDSAGNNADAASAFSEFERAAVKFSELEQQFPMSTRIDVALYYKGQTIHKQALLAQLNPELTNITFSDLLIAARLVYQELLDSEPLSKWSDNALHLQSSSYFHEAEYLIKLTNFVAGQKLLNKAIGLWQELLASPIYKTRNSADNAQYSLGRSYQLVLTVPVADRTRIHTGVNFAAIKSNNAITEYNKLINQFIMSRWIDNSYFNIATIFNNDALDTTVVLRKKRFFNSALKNYNIIITDYPGQLMEDDAASRIAQIYHDAGPGGITDSYCPLEKNWYNYVLIVSKNSILIDNANVHLSDLNITVPSLRQDHSCTTTKTLTLTPYPVP